MPLTSVKEVIEEIKEDLIDYLKIRGDLLQLKVAKAASPVVAKSIYTALLLLLTSIAGLIALLTTIFALALLFIESDTEPFIAMRGLTFGALCLLGFFILLLLILLLVKNASTKKMQAQIMSSVLNQQEAKEHKQLEADLSQAITEEEVNP